MPSREVARWANMSSISAVRSMTRAPKISSRLRLCTAVSSSSNMKRSASSSLPFRESSSALPLPMYVALSAPAFFWVNLPTTFAPAVLASSPNSARVS